jgi:hypothetical protein
MIRRAYDASMMTQQLGISILSAPVAAIDRRALSQAWYSALHVAREDAPRATRVRRQPLPATRSAAPHAHVPSPRSHETQSIERARRVPVRAAADAEPVERRAQRSSLARRIERTFLDPARHAVRATFTIDGTQARVHIALQMSSGGIRLIALCPAEVRDRVRAALDHVRYALAVRGIALRADLGEVTP